MLVPSQILHQFHEYSTALRILGNSDAVNPEWLIISVDISNNKPFMLHLFLILLYYCLVQFSHLIILKT